MPNRSGRTRAGALLFALCLGACCPEGGSHPRLRDAREADVQAATPVPKTVAQAAELGPRRCYDALRAEGVPHRTLHDRGTRAVAMPMRLGGALHGVAFKPLYPSQVHDVVDCRLALALAEWSRRLKRLGVTEVEYFSAYRPGARVAGTKKMSGHSRALALDAARFHLQSGEVYDVKQDWAGRERGGPVCPARRGEPAGSELLRSAVCEAVAMDVFQVILTPHHDRAHHNHVHLELVPHVDWTYVR